MGSLITGHAWSAIKVPLLVTLLRDRGSQGQLTSQERSWAQLALTQSDNQAAIGMFSSLERAHGGLVGASAAVQQTLRRAGDPITEVNTAPNSGGFTTFGQTVWSGRAATLFYRSLARGCLLAPTDTRYVLNLMSQVAGDQRWGMGQVNVRGRPVAFKGGWGPETGGRYLVRQSAIVGAGARGYVVTILAESGVGSFETGTQALTALARWVAGHIDPALSRPSDPALSRPSAACA
jgi:hypothetical protein